MKKKTKLYSILSAVFFCSATGIGIVMTRHWPPLMAIIILVGMTISLWVPMIFVPWLFGRKVPRTKTDTEGATKTESFIEGLTKRLGSVKQRAEGKTTCPECGHNSWHLDVIFECESCGYLAEGSLNKRREDDAEFEKEWGRQSELSFRASSAREKSSAQAKLTKLAIIAHRSLPFDSEYHLRHLDELENEARQFPLQEKS